MNDAFPVTLFEILFVLYHLFYLYCIFYVKSTEFHLSSSILHPSIISDKSIYRKVSSCLIKLKPVKRKVSLVQLICNHIFPLPQQCILLLIPCQQLFQFFQKRYIKLPFLYKCLLFFHTYNPIRFQRMVKII